ncbi:MAG: hypothetical protein BGO51_06165 [Rhodospirillales bacterium 69-11]|nr:MAG: hypothetical protein BGO51_06165 [Rhodospirillales bacterium 69-11]
MSIQNGAFLAGSGLDADSLMSADDLTRSQGAANIIPKFFNRTVSLGDGQFADEELVELLVPGDAKSGPVHVVTETIKKKFPGAYRAWKEGRDTAREGTPLELMVGDGALLHTLKAANVHTVEQLAGLTDGQLDIVPIDGRGLRERARKRLEMLKSAKDAAAEEAKDAEIKELKAKVAELSNLLKPSATAKTEDDDGAAAMGRPPEGAVPAPQQRPPRPVPRPQAQQR